MFKFCIGKHNDSIEISINKGDLLNKSLDANSMSLFTLKEQLFV